jgi:competence ComEA-like helix-hairpin-helix protein
VETPGGVSCVDLVTAGELHIRSGDRLSNGGRRRMAPARLAALAAPVDLNLASLDELASLDGVGPKLAERIAAARPFATVDDVGRVRGIGVRRLLKLRERLTVALDD